MENEMPKKLDREASHLFYEWLKMPGDKPDFLVYVYDHGTKELSDYYRESVRIKDEAFEKGIIVD